MRLFMLMLQLLLLAVLLHEVQGIRVLGGSLALDQYHVNEIIPNHGDVLCESNHCSGRIRKLITSSVSNTGTNHENGKSDEKKTRPISKSSSDKKKWDQHDEKMSVNSSSRNEQSAAEPYPDILDIAGMDYSQARRKSPIHN